MAPFRNVLHDPRLWGVRRRWVVPAFAVGLFIAFIPTPGHTLAACFAALALRVNIPIAAISTWVSNPATVFPMYYLCFRFGSWILDREPTGFAFEPTIDWLTHTFVTIWQPLLLGCLLIGTVTSVIGYFVLDGLWRLSLANYKARKRGTRKDSV